MCALLRAHEGRNGVGGAPMRSGNGVTARFSVDEAVGMDAAKCPRRDPQDTRKGEAIMFKNLIVTLGIAALTSGSALAATKAPKAKTPIVHKVAQAGEAKPAEAKTDGKAKAEKADKKDKKVKAEKKVEKKEVKPAEAAAPAPAPAPEKK
jgi:outer membrane biosynthesis protein TonB